MIDVKNSPALGVRCRACGSLADFPMPPADAKHRVKAMACGGCGRHDRLEVLTPGKYRRLAAEREEGATMRAPVDNAA